jgi:nucleotide-binding universal stress UspA family protein
MYDTILVTLDGSSLSERALPVAVTVAQATGAKLVLVRATLASVPPGIDPTDMQVKVVEDAKTYLAGIASQLTELGLQAEISVPYGVAPDKILMEIELHQADLVVMCTHGRSGLGRWIYGSVAESVLARSAVPILLVGPNGLPSTLSPKPGQSRFVVALDGSTFAEAILPFAVALAQSLDGTIVLLRVAAPPMLSFTPWSLSATPLVSPTPEVLEQVVADEQAETERYLGEVKERLRETNLRVETVVRLGAPAEAILEEGQKEGARGLIAMTTRGRTGLEQLLFGSVALEVLRRGTLPVLLVHPTTLPRKV